MIFNKREYLSILEIEDDTIEVGFDVLAELLLEKPANIIYCEKKGKLYGIISRGDIHRAREKARNTVEINTVFTYLQGFEYMKAREIFLKREKINALPIVDDKCRLIGNYSRWDDAFLDYTFKLLKVKKYVNVIKKMYSKIAIVKPSKSTIRKQKILNKWNNFLQELGIDVEFVHKEDIMEAFESKDIVLFIDKDEISGLGTFYEDILGKDFKWNQAKTLDEMVEALYVVTDEIVAETAGKVVLKNLIKSGVHVIALQIDQNLEGGYWKGVQNEIRTKFERIGAKVDCAIHEEFWEDFYDDKCNIDYISDVGTQNYPHIIEDGSVKLKDSQGKYYNVSNGERRTIGQPEKYNNTVYFFGPCLIVGWRTEDSLTIESQLQKIFNANGISSKVVNCGCWSYEIPLLIRICSTNFKKGDIAIVYDQNKNFVEVPMLNLAEVLEHNNVPARWYWDHPTHPNHKVFKLWAEEIYKFIPKHLLMSKATEKIDVNNVKYSLMISSYLERYFCDFKKKGKIGAIVMNCNPFTNGHRYLIEQASIKVDKLVIFVVEENKSLFSFKERLAMVCEGTKDLKNLMIVPSGRCILSQQTFPEYFLKIENEDVIKNAEYDILLFAEGIAPRLNIKYRFVGEEKDDPVTREYNEAMKRILPEHEIELVEIPRKTMEDGNAIRATNVRLLIENGDTDEIEEIVPETTKKMLMMSWD